MKNDRIKRWVNATGGSMSPCILSGSRLQVERVVPSQIRRGDVVCFIGADGQGVAHRVTAVVGQGKNLCFDIRGDALTVGETVPASAVTFRVTVVTFRHFSYRTDGLFGRQMAECALAQGALPNAARRVVRGAIKTLARVRRRVIDRVSQYW